MINKTEDRLAALEARLQLMEDELAIQKLVSSYGPLADGGRTKEVCEIWEKDGVYEIVGTDTFVGTAGLKSMFDGPGHQAVIKGGSAHFLSTPHVTVTGDTAHAVCYALLILHKDGGFQIARAVASDWRLRRTPSGWRAVHRLNRLLTGDQKARDILGSIAGAAA
jgi:hypothetical protein